MGLNISKGNMYEFVTHTWNTVKGACEHDCSYCYMKKWGKLNPIRFDEKELKTDLGVNNFIFVGSSNDLFAEGIPYEWIEKTLRYCAGFDNSYLFQTKNPARIEKSGKILHLLDGLKDVKIVTTIETNRVYAAVMNNAPTPQERAEAMEYLSHYFDTFVTIEPIMDFDVCDLIKLLQKCSPTQVNIGADTGRNNLPEPSKEKIEVLMTELKLFTKIHNKKNIKRLLS